MTTDESKGSTKVVLITGASSGIGEATARLLARKGLQVMLGARRTDRLETIASEIRAKGGSAEYRALDVTSLEEMQAFVGFAKEKFGRLDVMVNNAGLMPLSKLEIGTVGSAIVDNLEATQAALKKAGVEIIVPITE